MSCVFLLAFQVERGLYLRLSSPDTKGPPMSNVVTCIETARRYINASTVSVGDLYTAHALGTLAAGYMKRYPQSEHMVSLPCNGGALAHITVKPEDNGTGFYSYARVIAVTVEPAEMPEPDDSLSLDFAAL